MSFAQSKFGDGSASGAGNVTTTVSNHYGPRTSTSAKGVLETDGVVNELSIEFTGAEVSAGAYVLLAPYLPAGAIVQAAYLRVKEAFTLGGTTPTIEVGTEGSEATNGFTITEAQAEAVATYNLTSALSGTWAAPLAAQTTIGLAMAGSSPTSAATGVGEVVIRYVALPV